PAPRRADPALCRCRSLSLWSTPGERPFRRPPRRVVSDRPRFVPSPRRPALRRAALAGVARHRKRAAQDRPTTPLLRDVGQVPDCADPGGRSLCGISARILPGAGGRPPQSCSRAVVAGNHSASVPAQALPPCHGDPRSRSNAELRGGPGCLLLFGHDKGTRFFRSVRSGTPPRLRPQGKRHKGESSAILGCGALRLHDMARGIALRLTMTEPRSALRLPTIACRHALPAAEIEQLTRPQL